MPNLYLEYMERPAPALQRSSYADKAPADVQFCYEAGVCGFTLKRRIEALGCKCAVIAPSLTPKKPGVKIKTDRRDAAKLVAMFEAGLLTEVYPPSPQQEAARDLTRCRQTALQNVKRLRHQLTKFLTRHGYVYALGNAWTIKHFNWMRSPEVFKKDAAKKQTQTVDKGRSIAAARQHTPAANTMTIDLMLLSLADVSDLG